MQRFAENQSIGKVRPASGGFSRKRFWSVAMCTESWKAGIWLIPSRKEGEWQQPIPGVDADKWGAGDGQAKVWPSPPNPAFRLR